MVSDLYWTMQLCKIKLNSNVPPQSLAFKNLGNIWLTGALSIDDKRDSHTKLSDTHLKE